MQRSRPYTFTFVAVLAATMLRWLLDREMGGLAPFAPYYIAVVFGAWSGGSRPAMFGSLLSIGIYAVLFAGPLYEAGAGETAMALLLNLSVCASIAFFGEALHREKRSAESQAKRLKESEDRSSRAQRVAQAGTWEFDLVAQRAYLSPEFCRLVGRPYRESFSFEEAYDWIVPEDRPQVHRDLQATIAEKRRSYRVEHRHRLPGGEVRWRLSRGEVIYGTDGVAVAVVGATMDVHERKKAELALKLSEERFRSATEAINGMVYDLDRGSGMVTRSDGLIELMGLRPSEAERTEQWWLSRIHPEDLGHVTTMVNEVQRQREPLFDIEYRIAHAEGHWVWVNDKARLIYDEQGQAQRIVGCTIDITVRKKAEMELQNADRRKDEFLATLAHELRNPLSPLQHAIDLLDVMADEKAMILELRAMMERQMKHLVRLVDDLLDVSRISRGKIELRMRPVDLAECLRSAVEANRFLIDRSQHDLQVVVPAGPCVVVGDRERLIQVMSNLLNNAAKFTPASGSIKIMLEVSAQEAIIQVQDNGPGLEHETIDRIFDMFVQGGTRTHTTVTGGLGIGLNLVRRLVVMHGGSVSAWSEGAGKGAIFKVKLPIAQHVPQDLAVVPALDRVIAADPATIPRT